MTLPSLLLVTLAQATPVPGLVFAAETSLVNVSVAVEDGRGQPVSGLGAKDFVLVEDGKRRPVELCAQVGGPGSERATALDVALLVDTSDSMLETLRRSQEAATRFLSDLPNTQDRLVVLFDQTQRLDRFDPEHPGELFERLARIPDGGNTALRDAVTFTLKNLGASGGRSAIVLLTDGVDTVSQVSPLAMEKAVQSKAVVIYPIAYPPPPGADGPGPQEAARTLERLAQLSGGRMFRLASEASLPAALEEILADLKAQYVLGFTPSEGGAAGRLRKIQIKVAGRGKTVVRHRLGYRLD